MLRAASPDLLARARELASGVPPAFVPARGLSDLLQRWWGRRAYLTSRVWRRVVDFGENVRVREVAKVV